MPEEVLAELTSCFSAKGSMPELGLGEAEILTVLSGWKRHLSLWQNAQTFTLQATILQMLLFAFGIATTVTAVFFSQNKTDEKLEQAMVILPIATGVISTVRSKLRFREKGGACLMGAYNIVSELYKYRLRACQYDVRPAPAANDDDGEQVRLSPKQLEQRARELCVTTCQEIYADALSSEVSKGSALNFSSTAVLNTASAEERDVFVRNLQKHISQNLYGQRKPEAIPTRIPTLGSAKVSPIDVEKGEKKSRGGEIDDFTSPLELEIYVEFRVRSCARRLENIAPGLARQLNLLEVLALLSNATGGVIAVFGYAQWVSVCVAAGIIFSALQDYYSLPAQVTATNESTSEIHSLLSWWDSLSLVQRKAPDAKTKCADIAESAICKQIAAKTSSTVKGAKVGPEESEGEKES